MTAAMEGLQLVYQKDSFAIVHRPAASADGPSGFLTCPFCCIFGRSSSALCQLSGSVSQERKPQPKGTRYQPAYTDD